MSLKVDVDAMLKAAMHRVRPTGRRAILPISAKNREELLLALASAIVASGRDAPSLTSIASLIDVDAIVAGLEHILDRLGKDKAVCVHQIAKLACTMGRRWVKVPKDHQGELEAIRRNVDPGRHGMTEKNRAVLRMFEDPDVVRRFDSQSARVWKRAPAPSEMKMSDAVLLQAAFAIEILSFAPIRLKNLVSINIDRNIIDRGHGRGRAVHLFFPKSEVKNAVELEFALQASTVAMLDRYLQDVRPRLLRVPSRWLFPGEGAGPKSDFLLSRQITDLVEREVGVRLTVHQFRHLAGFLYLRENPGAHEIVRQLLGHRSIATTLSHYAGMETAEAVRHFDRHVEMRRTQTPFGRTCHRASFR